MNTELRTSSLHSLMIIGGRVLAAFAASYVLIAHPVRVLEWLPFALLLACPLMHIVDVVLQDLQSASGSSA